MHPFSSATLKVLLLITAVFAGFYFVQLTWHPLINIVVKTLVICLIYLSVVLKLRLSEDIEQLLKKLLS